MLRNAWHIGAWADELGDKPNASLDEVAEMQRRSGMTAAVGERRRLTRCICGDPVVLFREGANRAPDRGLDRQAPGITSIA